MSKETAYKEYFKREFGTYDLWKDSAIDLGGQMIPFLRKFKLEQFADISEHAANVVKTALVGQLSRTPEELLGLGYNIAAHMKRTADDMASSVEELIPAVESIANDLINNRLTKLNLSGTLSNLKTAVESQPFKVNDILDNLRGTLSGMGSSISDNFSHITDIVEKTLGNEEVQVIMGRLDNMVDDFRTKADLSFIEDLVKPQVLSKIGTLLEKQSTFDMSGDLLSGVHFFKDMYNGLQSLLGMAELLQSRNVAGAILENIPSDTMNEFNQALTEIRQWSPPELDTFLLPARGIINMAARTLNGTIPQITQELQNVLAPLKQNFSDLASQAVSQFRNLDITPIAKFESNFMGQLQEVVDNLGLDRLADSLKIGSIEDIFDIDANFATYYGVMTNQLREAYSQITSTEMAGKIQKVMTEVTSGLNVLRISGERAAKFADLLNADVEERVEYLQKRLADYEHIIGQLNN